MALMMCRTAALNKNSQYTMGLIDSGSAVMACPPSEAEPYSIVESTRKLILQAIGGQLIEHYSQTTVPATMPSRS